MSKRKIGYRIGNVPACRNINIINFQIVKNLRRNVPGIAFADPVLAVDGIQTGFG